MTRGAAIAACLARACRLDVVACKPGNVSLWSPGHGMQARDFLVSARVAVPALCDDGASVGARIESAMHATLTAVGCNTNLGIVLLLAPLAAAAARGGELRPALAAVLAALDRDDAAAAFRAIAFTEPAGLGQVAEGDVREVPRMTLREAMALAAIRDRIAAAYVDDYTEVFEHAVPTLVALRERWRSLAWASTACFLQLLGAGPDSHIARKWGGALADEVSARARTLESALKACENPRAVVPRLRAFDDDLKSRGVNPGTSADLTVASVAVLLLRERLA